MTQAQRIASWVHTSNFTVNSATLRSDARAVLRELERPTSTAPELHTVCGVFLNDLAAANAALPTPDRQASALLAQAYGDLGAGGTLCYRANRQPAVRRSAMTWIYRGANELFLGVSRLNAAR